MWSGARTISSYLLRAFENRTDTQVLDEPFFAYYLTHTGIEHPGRSAILKDAVTDAVAIEATLCAPLEAGKTIIYQNHMSQHQLIGMDQSWLQHMDHAFLIEDPVYVLARYKPSDGPLSISDLGLPQQLSMFDYIADKFGKTPPVVDAADIRKNPAEMLRKLCVTLGISFDEAMLSWPAGSRATDGAGAPWRFSNIEASTGFEKPLGRARRLDESVSELADLAMTYYDRLSRYRL